MLGELGFLTATVVAIDFALLARSWAVLHPSLLPTFAGSTARLAVVAAALWTLAPSVDVLQVLVRRRQRRSEFRLATDLRVTVGGVAATAVDLTPNGIGISLSRAPEIGAVVPLVIGVPRLSGDVELVSVDGEARHVEPSSWGRCRAGFALVAPSPTAVEALVEYCSVTHHRGMRADQVPDLSRLPALAPGDLAVHRDVRVHAVLALANTLAVVLGSVGVVLGPLRGSVPM